MQLTQLLAPFLLVSSALAVAGKPGSDAQDADIRRLTHDFELEDENYKITAIRGESMHSGVYAINAKEAARRIRVASKGMPEAAEAARSDGDQWEMTVPMTEKTKKTEKTWLRIEAPGKPVMSADGWAEFLVRAYKAMAEEGMSSVVVEIRDEESDDFEVSLDMEDEDYFL